ncbi:cutinase family protein [Corynebacterium crudilactis]|uniref:Cutinase n=1 Tax=Corynebacterium crudilactis TaxID=1652495 RepID=A0A172QXR1_9CORY|nr:cutinase family protein [Corynebacterium crudilactis]ANE05484.1 hypothetical protein ccrud_14175 [Corynebacterium crudilactis]
MRFSQSLSAVGATCATVAVVSGMLSPPVATAQTEDVLAQVVDAIPGAVQLPDLDGLPGTAGGLTAESGISALKQNEMVQNALAWETNTKAPVTEVSAGVQCAPLMLVAVPGTFEINRDQSASEPVGMLGSFAEPLQALGSGFSQTYIAYDADAGVSGTSYAQSVQRGVEKTLATIQDAQDNCDGRVVLAGFSQGAHIAGDVATLIGNRQTGVDPSTVAGVVLFADPKRDENANVLVGTSAEVPTLPAVVGDAVEKLMEDPSIAQLQMTAGQVSGIAGQLLGGQSDAGAEKTSAPVVAGQQSSPTSSVTPSHESSAVEMTNSSATVQAPTFSSAVHSVAAPVKVSQASNITGFSDTVDPELPTFDDSDDDATREAATGVIVPGRLGDSPRQSVLVDLSDAEKASLELGVGQVWATPENMAVLADHSDIIAERTDLVFDKVLDAGTQDTVDRVLGRDLVLQDQVGQVYRAGACDELTFADCVSLFSGAAGIAALTLQLETIGDDVPSDLVGIPAGNLMETGCVDASASACAATPVAESSTLPVAEFSQISDVSSVVGGVSGDASGDVVESSESTASETPTSESSESSASSVAAAGAQSRPTTEPAEEASSSTTSAAAGAVSRPTTSESPTTASTTASTSKKYEGTLGGATTGVSPDGEEVQGISPITMNAVAGGGVAGQREQGFGDLVGSVVSLCVPGDIVCSLPENSQLARDLVQIGENISTNMAGVAKEALAGNTRMGGLLAVEAVNTIAQVSGLPPLKLSPETIEMLITLVTGGAMIAAGDPTGAGVAMIASTIGQMPQALPELYAQLQDIPVIIEALPGVADNVARNLGLADIAQRLGVGFENAGMTNITDIGNLPAAVTSMATDLLEDNSGLMDLATNPDYLKTGAHSEAGFRSVYIADGIESFTWSQDWVAAIREMVS